MFHSAFFYLDMKERKKDKEFFPKLTYVLARKITIIFHFHNRKGPSLAVARLLLHLEIQIVFFRSRYSCPTCGNVFYVVSKWHRKIVIAFFPAIFLSDTIFHSSNIRQYYVLRAPIVYKLFIMAKQGKFFMILKTIYAKPNDYLLF